MVKYFKEKKILVMGLGLHGGALAVIKWLLKNKAIITITDSKSKHELKNTLEQINKFSGSSNIKYTLGEHRFIDFSNQDLIIQNPAVPASSSYLKKARQLNIPIINEAVMFFGMYPGHSIGVTGTRGKSTTATLIHKILKTEIKTNVVAGNIAIHPMFEVIDQLKVKSLPVIELSSWHLENMAEYKVSPYIAVVTNVLNDHLNRYHNFAEYKKAKLAILKNQIKSDLAILNFDNVASKSFAKYTKAKVYFYSIKKKVKGAYLKNNVIYFYNGQKTEAIMTIEKVKVLGQHNLSNVLGAITVAKLVGINNKNIIKAVNAFKGIQYRLESKGKIANAEIYNDATSTTPDASLAAIKALNSKKIVLIAGGEDKKLNYSQLAKQIKSKVQLVILLSGSGSQKLIKELRDISYPSSQLIRNVKFLNKAWDFALNNLKDNKFILFSPAAASFNMFKNEFDRACQFDKLIYETKKKKK